MTSPQEFYEQLLNTNTITLLTRVNINYYKPFTFSFLATDSKRSKYHFVNYHEEIEISTSSWSCAISPIYFGYGQFTSAQDELLSVRPIIEDGSTKQVFRFNQSIDTNNKIAQLSRIQYQNTNSSLLTNILQWNYGSDGLPMPYGVTLRIDRDKVLLCCYSVFYFFTSYTNTMTKLATLSESISDMIDSTYTTDNITMNDPNLNNDAPILIKDPNDNNNILIVKSASSKKEIFFHTYNVNTGEITLNNKFVNCQEKPLTYFNLGGHRTGTYDLSNNFNPLNNKLYIYNNEDAFYSGAINLGEYLYKIPPLKIQNEELPFIININNETICDGVRYEANTDVLVNKGSLLYSVGNDSITGTLKVMETTL